MIQVDIIYFVHTSKVIGAAMGYCKALYLPL